MSGGQMGGHALVPLAAVKQDKDSRFLRGNHHSQYSRKALEAVDLTYRAYEGPDSEDELGSDDDGGGGSGNGNGGKSGNGRYFNAKLRHHFPVALRSFLLAYKKTVQPKLAALGLEQQQGRDGGPHQQ